MKVGLFFGSFNPIHIGHLIIANHVLNETNIDKLWLVISPQNPFKQSNSLLNEYDRLHLVRLAIEEDNRMKASDIEFSLPRPSYTIDTLTYLQEKYPANTFTIIMGSDSFQNIGKWKNAEQLLSNYEIAVYKRPGFEINEQGLPPTVTILKAPFLDISATTIRNFLQQGKSVRYMLPDKVREEIEKSGYYKKAK